MPYEGSEYFNIIVEYEEFLTRFDLDEILSSIDRIIENEVLSNLDADPLSSRRRHHYLFPHGYRDTPELSYVGIASVERGSIVLAVLAPAAIAADVARRFRSEVDKRAIVQQLERSGKLSSAPFGAALARINDWAEQYVPRQRQLGGKVKTVRAVPRRRSEARSAS